MFSETTSKSRDAPLELDARNTLWRRALNSARPSRRYRPIGRPETGKMQRRNLPSSGITDGVIDPPHRHEIQR